MTVKFNTPAKADVSAIARFAPPWVKNVAGRLDGNNTIIEFETDSDSGFHDFKDGTHVVLDVLAPKTDADAYAPPGTAKVKPTPLAANAPKTDAVTNAQAQVIASAAAKLAGNTAAPVAPAPAQKPLPQTPAPASPPPAAAA